MLNVTLDTRVDLYLYEPMEGAPAGAFQPKDAPSWSGSLADLWRTNSDDYKTWSDFTTEVVNRLEALGYVLFGGGAAATFLLKVADEKPQTGGAAVFRRALDAAEAFYDWASVNETEWTGWGEQTVPAGAEWWRVKAKQAVSALEECRSIEQRQSTKE